MDQRGDVFPETGGGGIARLTGSDPNPSAGYPIVTFTWVLLYKSGNGARAALLRRFFNFMLSELTQTQSPELGYVTIPQAAFEKTMAKVVKSR